MSFEKQEKVFRHFPRLHEYLFCEILYCTYCALAYIVCVVGVAGKQPMHSRMIDVYKLAWNEWRSRWEMAAILKASTCLVNFNCFGLFTV